LSAYLRRSYYMKSRERKLAMVVFRKSNISATTVLAFSFILCVSSNPMLLDSMCGTILHDSCSQQQQVVENIKGSESCAERAPWNVILERRGGRRKRTADRDDTRIRDKRAPSDELQVEWASAAGAAQYEPAQVDTCMWSG
jgi:hypothetical protein